MNCIVLEGTTLYVFLATVLILLLVAIFCLIIAIVADKRNFTLAGLLFKENCKVKNLSKENFILKIKCGEFSIDD